MLYIIGLGLNIDGISNYGLEAVKKCKKVYLENYTVDFPYSEGELREFLGKKLIPANRDFVEGLEIVDEAEKTNVALLVYGSPLTATTHISLIEEARRLGVRYKVIYSASIFDAVSETGLQLYKFGKVASMPAWDENKGFTPDSFMEIVKDNSTIHAHSLILTDIGLDFGKAIEQLEKASENHPVKIKNIVVCQSLGTRNKRIYYGPFEMFRDMSIKKPYCIIIPGKLHFIEKEVLESYGS